MASAPSLNPPPTGHRASLLSLPSEILVNIASHFDRTTAKAFALVASRFTIFSEPALWRSLELSLQPHFGERPWNAEPVRDDSVGGTGLWPSHEAEIWRHRAMREMAHGMILSGNAKRWGMVEKMRMVVYNEALYRMMAVLDIAAPSLLCLAIQPNPRRFCLFAEDTLDYHLFRRHLPFPSLTHLILGPRTVFYPATLLNVIDRAPHLISLDVNFNGRETFDDDLGMGNDEFDDDDVKPTKLQWIRYICNQAEGAEEAGILRLLVQLLKNSQGLKQLTLDYSDEEADDFMSLWSAVRSLPELRDLHWRLMSQVIIDGTFGTSGGFLSLRRLIMDNGYWIDLFLNVIPDISNLEVIYLPEWGDDAELHLGPGMSYEADYPYQPQEKFCDFDQVHFFDSVRQCPKLRAIHIPTGVQYSPPHGETDIFTLLDDIEKEDRVMGRINSLRHGTEELVHLRYLLPWESRPTEDAGVTWHLPGQDDRVGMEPVRDPRYPGWRDVLDLNGLEVPACILKKMREVEGVAEGAWRGRGIEVGGDAWKVLTDWRRERLGTGEQAE